MKVKNCLVEQTGGYIYVAYGSLEDGRFFAIGSDMLLIYDADEYVARDNEDFDAYEWEKEHTLQVCPYNSNEHKDILKQVYDKCDDGLKDTYDLFRDLLKDEIQGDFYRDSQGNLCYQGKHNYSLLEGKTDKNYTSDILFIFREPTIDEINSGYVGEVVNFLYGGFNNIDNIEETILDYERKESEK